MAIPTVVIRWLDVNDKDVTNPAKYQIVNKNYNPSFLPVIGSEPDLEYFVKRTPFAQPNYDPRLVNLIISDYPVDEFDSEYPTNRKWVTTYALVDRSKEDIKTAVDEIESLSNNQLFPTHKQLKLLTLASFILDRRTQGLVLTAKELIILNIVRDKAIKIWQNYINGETKKEAIDADQPYNLDTDWELIDPETE